jgi:elongation factor Ts
MLIELELVVKLREMTGAGVVDCRDALKESSNNINRACQWLREKGRVSAIKKIKKSARQGLIYSYIHGNGILGVLVEINCETDFVAKTEYFKTLVKEIAIQIAAIAPTYISREQVPDTVLNVEKEIYKAQLKIEDKPEIIWNKIIENKIEKFYSQVCLYDQIYIRDINGKETIKDLIADTIAKTGENIIVKRFARFKVGEE